MKAKIGKEEKQNVPWKLKETGIVEFQWISTASNEADMFTKNWWDWNITSMLRGHVGMANTTALCKIERVMNKGVCQESWGTHQ